MSEIDSYKHECIGIIACPSSFWPPFPFHEPPPPGGGLVPLYLLHEDALDAGSFEAKSGDLLLGGGSGEAPALRISMPETLIYYSREDYEEWMSIGSQESGLDAQRRLHHAYWSISHAFIMGDGYAKRGWDPHMKPLEMWLAQHILAFVLCEYPQLWSHVQGSRVPGEDGSICRLPIQDEKAL